MTRSIATSSADETRAFGRRLGARLDPGAVVGLRGDLGAGKTCLVQGIAAGLDIPPAHVTSPTFTLVAEHYTGRLPLFHLDLYRLAGADVEELGYADYLFGRGVTVIEWFDHLAPDVVDAYLSIAFVCEAGDRRRLTLTPHGEPYERLLAGLFAESVADDSGG